MSIVLTQDSVWQQTILMGGSTPPSFSRKASENNQDDTERHWVPFPRYFLQSENKMSRYQSFSAETNTNAD